MRVFLAGATGVIGSRLIPLLVESGHEVCGLSRTPGNEAVLKALDAQAVIGDVFESDWLTERVVEFSPDIVIHQLTDLPDDIAEIGAYSWANALIRQQGTANLLTAAAASGADRFLCQSVAWPLGGGPGEAVSDMEQAVLAHGGVVLRYGQFYGPDTYHPGAPPTPPRVEIAEAARQTVTALDHPSGIVLITDPDSG